MRCPECAHRWIDRTRRTVIDGPRDACGDFIVSLVFGAAVLLSTGLLLVGVGWLFTEAAGARLGAYLRPGCFFAGSFASLIVLGRL